MTSNRLSIESEKLAHAADQFPKRDKTFTFSNTNSDLWECLPAAEILEQSDSFLQYIFQHTSKLIVPRPSATRVNQRVT